MELETVKKDLLEKSEKDFFMKYIIKSYNWYFAEYQKIPVDCLAERLDLLNEIVSQRFGIGFHSIQIVGSAKTGFSLSPYKIFAPFRETFEGKESSDIDIALVSDYWYSLFWQKIKRTPQIYYSENQELFVRLSKSIFKGFINEKDICKITNLRVMWHRYADLANKELQDRFVHPITYRIYRSWEDLEDYQLYGIKKAKQQLER